MNEKVGKYDLSKFGQWMVRVIWSFVYMHRAALAWDWRTEEYDLVLHLAETIAINAWWSRWNA